MGVLFFLLILTILAYGIGFVTGKYHHEITGYMADKIVEWEKAFEGNRKE